MFEKVDRADQLIFQIGISGCISGVGINPFLVKIYKFILQRALTDLYVVACGELNAEYILLWF